MSTDLEGKFDSLKQAKRDFLLSAKRLAAGLDKRRDRLVADAKRANDRVKKTGEQLKIKSKQLAVTSKARAKRTHEKFEALVQNLKKATGKRAA